MTANIITICRIVMSSVLFFLPSKSAGFLIPYLLCGVSDVLDGYIARKTHTESKTGEVLDSVADMVFLTAVAVKILPQLELPKWILIWVFLIAACKLAGVIAGLTQRNRLFLPHTAANKLTGCLLFLYGAAALYVDSIIPAAVVCASATFAAVQELIMIIRHNKRT